MISGARSGISSEMSGTSDPIESQLEAGAYQHDHHTSSAVTSQRKTICHKVVFMTVVFDILNGGQTLLYLRRELLFGSQAVFDKRHSRARLQCNPSANGLIGNEAANSSQRQKRGLATHCILSEIESATMQPKDYRQRTSRRVGSKYSDLHRAFFERDFETAVFYAWKRRVCL